MHVIFLGWMDRHLCRRQSENEPPASDIDVGHFQDVAQESAIGIGVLTVYNRMRANNHDTPPLTLTTLTTLASRLAASLMVAPNVAISRSVTICRARCEGGDAASGWTPLLASTRNDECYRPSHMANGES